jgi:hypothetical protein
MTVKKEPSGRRWVEVDVEVPGAPEEVWQAIATGPGISAWFVPTRIEAGEDGRPVRAVADFGPGMESVATVTSWDPPRKYTADSADLGPDAPAVATEWIVEARAGGACVVRVVHGLFASGADWDHQLEGWAHGWPAFFRILRLYLTHFRGEPAAAFQLMAMAARPRCRAWAALTGPLGLAGAAAGQRVSTPAGVLRLGGLVEQVREGRYRELLLRLDAPAPGLAHLFAMPMGGRVFLSLRIYLYGDRAAAAAAEAEPEWRA